MRDPEKIKKLKTCVPSSIFEAYLYLQSVRGCWGVIHKAENIESLKEVK